MHRHREFERIKEVLADSAPEEPLTAREIRDLLAEHGVEVDSAHRVATVLGYHAETDAVDVIHSSPYRYRIRCNS